MRLFVFLLLSLDLLPRENSCYYLHAKDEQNELRMRRRRKCVQYKIYLLLFFFRFFLLKRFTNYSYFFCTHRIMIEVKQKERKKERDGCIILLAIQTKTNPWLLACFHCFKLKSLWTISIPSISTTHTPAMPATPHQKNKKKPNKTFKVLLFFVDSKDQCHIDSISLASLFSSPLGSSKTRTVFS